MRFSCKNLKARSRSGRNRGVSSLSIRVQSSVLDRSLTRFQMDHAISVWDWFRILTDPDPHELARMIRVGQNVTWPKVRLRRKNTDQSGLGKSG